MGVKLKRRLQKYNLISRSVTVPSSVIAQQYPSTAFLYSCLHFRKVKFAALFKNVIILLFLFSLNCAILQLPNLVLC